MAFVQSITLNGATTTSADTLVYTVNFSAAVTGVDVTDFVLNKGGTTNGTISTVSGSGATWYVTVTGVTGDGALELETVASPTIYNDGTTTQITGSPYTAGPAYTLDNSHPTVTSVALPADATYHSGETLSFLVTFDQAFTVTGEPRIALTIGSSTVYAKYISTAGNVARFEYTVPAGSVDADGITIGALQLNGGTIRDGVGNDAILTLTGLPATTPGIKVDATEPTVVSATATGGTFLVGQDLVFTVKYNEVVTVAGGTPYLNVMIGDKPVQATMVTGGPASDTLTFRYTVQANEEDLDGVTVGNGIVLNGATIRDAQSNNATIAGITFSGTSSVLVDSTAPTVKSITRVGSEITKGTTQQFTVTFSENVTNVDAADFTLVKTGSVTGSIASVSGSGSTYTVTVTGVGGDGDLKLNLNASATGIVDARSLAIATGYTAGERFAIDNSPPPAPTIAVVAGNDQISAGETAGLKITGTSQPLTTVVLYIAGSARSVTMDALGNWSYDVTDNDLRAMGSGPETLSVTAADALGNTTAAVTRDITVDIGVVPSGPTTPTPGTGTPGTKPTSVTDVVKLPAAEATKAVLETANIIPDSAKVTASTGTAATVYKNISAAISEYQSGSISLEQLETRLVDATLPTTGVAHDVYKFFTGSAPTAAGMAYLIDSTANTTDLTDPYYGIFTLENRYINFSVNLGKLGEGRASFEAKYGAMSFTQAVEKAYGDVIGFANAVQAGVDFSAALAYIESKRSYFEALGGDALGAKAAMVGYVISVGSTFHLGNYYEELKDYVLDGVVANAGSSPAANWDLI